MKQVSFIVLNYNDMYTTKKLVDALVLWKRDAFNFNIVIVDNMSKDNSFEFLLNEYKNIADVDVIRSERNGGYSYGNNYGMIYAINKYNPDYIAIANPDIEVEHSTFVELVKSFSESSDIAVVAPAMKDINGNYSIRSQKLPTLRDDVRLCFNSSSNRTFKSNNDCVNNKKNFIITEMVPGSFFVVKTDYFKKVGLFDDGVFLFCEERILGKKMKDCGYKIVLRSDLFFVHAHSVSIKKAYDILSTWKLIMKSRCYYQKKYNRSNFAQLWLLKICSFIFVICLDIKLKLYNMLNRKK